VLAAAAGVKLDRKGVTIEVIVVTLNNFGAMTDEAPAAKYWNVSRKRQLEWRCSGSAER
jgi:hypothetical protein